MSISVEKRLNNKSGYKMYILPKIPPFTKCTRLKYSNRSFCIGVPDSKILLLAFSPFKA